MSIWSTWLFLEDGMLGGDDPPGAPYVSLDSHVFPRKDGEREGSLEVAAIPGFISADGVAAVCSEREDRVHPWLRIGLEAYDHGPMVERILDVAMVERLRDTLSEWLNRVR